LGKELAGGKLLLDEPPRRSPADPQSPRFAQRSRSRVARRDRRGHAVARPRDRGALRPDHWGGQAFSAGYDIAAIPSESFERDAEALVAHPFQAALDAIAAHPWPVIAAINGHALAVGSS